MSQQINLYEARLKPNRSLLTCKNVSYAAFLLIMHLLPLIIWVKYQTHQKVAAAAVVQKSLDEEQKKLAEISKTLAAQTVSAALAADLEMTKAALKSRREVFEYLDSGKLGNTDGFSAVMRGFSNLTQNELWLTGFSVINGGADIEVKGRMLDQEKLPPYVQMLRSQKAFQGRSFATLEMKSIEPKPLNSSAQNATLQNNDPASAEPSLPRYIEFVLRSENIAEMAKDKKTGANQ